MRKLLVASTFLCAMSGYALAADAVVVESPPEVVVAPVFSWTGGYIGGQVGYRWGDATVSDNVSGDFSNPDPDDWLAGVYFGYNYQMANNVVIGADADFAWTGADEFGELFDSAGVPYADGSGDNLELDCEGAVRARLGYAVDRFLPYIAGGVAFGRVTQEEIAAGGAVLTSDHDTLVGWTIGAGVEYAFTDNLIGRAEYRYTDFGDGDITFSDDAPGNIDLSTNDVRLGIAYKF
jgi:outer membrane immunogenic protein